MLAVFEDWEWRLSAHALRPGYELERAGTKPLPMLVEGACILGRVRQSKDPPIRAGESFLKPRGGAS